ncbi:general secretion pathway protein GspB [Permianibacter aggregans]|uniref:Type II secretion system protein B n=1 Tax=Permianibacter aggregans TaxID=1510150 RepID=A0A4R6UV84_9GAMM|nr:general secretion pathway protein GspB [Permianibacter aggregans]QGX39416.1 hypothetical protein E2H98_06975 [Permianibacter aggregans]TDQ49849.1 type II secretion system protein B [Permianibacter aggregans]
MSYLLDALRKSEQERQQNVPNLHTPIQEWEAGEESESRSPWLIVIAALLAVICLLLALMLWRNQTVNDAAPVPVTAASSAPSASVSTTPAATTPNSEQPIKVREKPSLPVRTGNRVVEKAPVVTANKPAPANASAPEFVIDGPVPRAYELPRDLRSEMPPLTMNSHIYSTDAKSSFVMINGSSIEPGQTLTPDLKLLAITADGAVLEFRGTRFLLPAMSSFEP